MQLSTVGWYRLEEWEGWWAKPADSAAPSEANPMDPSHPLASLTGMRGGEVSARDFGGGGGGLMNDCLMIAGAGWIIGMQYNALLWVKVVEVGYLCAGSLADYSSVIAKQS